MSPYGLLHLVSADYFRGDTERWASAMMGKGFPQKGFLSLDHSSYDLNNYWALLLTLCSLQLFISSG